MTDALSTTFQQQREQYVADIKAKRWCMYVPKQERPVLSRLIDLVVGGGNVISVHDSEEWVVKRSSDKALIRSQLGHAEEDTLVIHDNKGEELGFFYFIYDNGSENDPMVVICDYSANEYCENIYRILEMHYG